MSTPDSRRVELDDGTHLTRAPLAWRLVARAVDMALVGAAVVWGVLQAVDRLFRFCGGYGGGCSGSEGSSVPYLLLVLAAACYEPVAIAASGRTLGKALAGVEVVRVSGSGNPSFGKSLLRVTLPTVLFLSPLGLGWLAAWVAVGISVLANKEKRGLHDKMADTVVVRSPSRLWRQPDPRST